MDDGTAEQHGIASALMTHGAAVHSGGNPMIKTENLLRETSVEASHT